MASALKLGDAAGVASMEGRQIREILQSVWIGAYASRMQYHASTSLVLIATAVNAFPRSGWTNFFNLPQETYTEKMLDVNRERLSDYQAFIYVVGSIVTLPFNTREFGPASKDRKVAMTIQAFSHIRPTKNIAEWQFQGNIALELNTKAIQDLYIMYKSVSDPSRGIAYLAYYSLMLLGDVAKQCILQAFNNTYRSPDKPQ